MAGVIEADTAEPASCAPPLELLRCPQTGGPLAAVPGGLAARGGPMYRISAAGVPLFAPEPDSADARQQQEHYDAIAIAYEANLAYPHTRAYFEHLDAALRDAALAACGDLGDMAEICCGLGEAPKLFEGRYRRAVGIDISPAMLARAAREHRGRPASFAQADATRLPLADAAFDTVVMLGGIHHVNDRAGLFREVARVLKPGGRFIFREPVSDFFLWRLLRAVIYRVSPMLDHRTERPLAYAETAPYLAASGLRLTHWSTHGFLGFCVFMNSDVLVVTRLLRFVPGIAAITRVCARADAVMLRLPGMRRRGLQVVGVAEKPL